MSVQGTRLDQECNPVAIAAATNVKLARQVQADDCMEVDGDEQRCSSDVDPSNP